MVLVIAGTAILTGLGNGTFWEPDEPRFAEATRQMFQRGDFVTLTSTTCHGSRSRFFFTGHRPRRSPRSARTSSLPDFPPHLPASASSSFSICSVRDRVRRAGLVGALILSTMFRFVTFARIGLTDVPVMFFIVAALYGFVRAVHRRSAVWVFVGWSCVGLGMLTKGPVGLLPVAIWAMYAAFSRDWSLFGRVRPIVGMMFALAIALPWYVWMVVQHGRAFTDFALGHEIVERMISEDAFAPTRGFFYYFKVWPGDAAPWSALFVASVGWIAWRWSSLDNATRRSIVFAASWFIAVFLLFSLSRSKVPHYVLPAYPAAALLVGVFVDRLADTRDDARWWGVPMAIIALASIVAAAATGLFLDVLAPGDTTARVAGAWRPGCGRCRDCGRYMETHAGSGGVRAHLHARGRVRGDRRVHRPARHRAVQADATPCAASC